MFAGIRFSKISKIRTNYNSRKSTP